MLRLPRDKVAGWEKGSLMKNKATLIVRVLYAVFLVGTGAMTISFQFSPPDWPQSPAGEFLIAAGNTGYLVAWVGLFKVVTGILMLFPRMALLAYLMALPYAVNILLWVTFVAHEWLLIGIPNFLAAVFLVATHFDHYRPLFTGDSAHRDGTSDKREARPSDVTDGFANE